MYLQSIIKKIGIGIFVLIIIGYSGYKLIPKISGPQIIVDNIGTASTSNIFTISGTALRAKEVRIFDRQVKLDENGKWTETLVKQDPYTEVHIIAKDKWDKEVTETVIVR